MIIIVESWNYHDTYFIFRSNGGEIKFTLKEGIIKPEKPLTITEINYIKTHIPIDERSTELEAC